MQFFFNRSKPVKKKTTLDTGPPRDGSDSDNDLASDNEDFYEDIVRSNLCFVSYLSFLYDPKNIWGCRYLLSSLPVLFIFVQSYGEKKIHLNL